MNGTSCGALDAPSTQSEPRVRILAAGTGPAEQGQTEWLSVELELEFAHPIDEVEVEGRLWSPVARRWLRTWDIRHSAPDGTLVRRVAAGPSDTGEPILLELAVPAWAVLSPQAAGPVEVAWDLRVCDAQGKCVARATSPLHSVSLPVRPGWAGSLAHAQLATALGVAAASVDGAINSDEEAVVRLGALEAVGPLAAARRTVLDIVDCLLYEPVAAWEYLEAFLQALQPDPHRVEALVDLALRVAAADGPLVSEESLLIAELKRRLQGQCADEPAAGAYVVDLDQMELHSVGGDGPWAIGDSIPLAAPADQGQKSLLAPVALMASAPASELERQLVDLYEAIACSLARQAGFAPAEHHPRPDTLLTLLEETGTLCRELAMELRFVTSLCGRLACGEALGESKLWAALAVGREAYRCLEAESA